MYYLIHHNLQLNGSTSITFPDMVIFSSTCFWTPIPVIFWGMCTTKDIFPRKYRYIYIAILLSNPFFYGLINIFIFYCHWWSKDLSLTFPFQLPSRSVAATLKPSSMNQQLRIPSKTLTALFFTYHHKINSLFPCPFGSFCSSEFTPFLTISINSGRFCLFTNNASSRSLSDLMKVLRK